MKKRIFMITMLSLILVLSLSACSNKKEPTKIGVSLGVGKAIRWEEEKAYMEARAKEVGADIEVRLNQTDEPKTQQEDCFEMIDNGIDVLILTARDVNKVDDILAYAKDHKVPVVAYARALTNENVNLFVGYDSNRIGQKMGQYLSEKVSKGDYIILQGDENDANAKLLYDGAMRYIDPIKGNLNIILDASVPGWSSDEAEKMVIEAVSANGNNVDAILASNDKLAGASAEALNKLGITKHVEITGMDAELDAIKRILAGTQDSTIYMDLKELSTIAVDEAIHLAKGEKVNVNAEFSDSNGRSVDANLITGQLIVKENIDKILIDSGYFTKEEVYGE